YFIRAFVLVGTAATVISAQQAVVPNASKFLVLLRSAQIGTEDIAVTQKASGGPIPGAGRKGAPLELVTKMLQIRYDPEWKPIDLNLDATARNQAIALQISVNGTSATTHLTRGGQTPDTPPTMDAGR